MSQECICDLSGDASAKYISRVTRLEAANKQLAGENTRLREWFVWVEDHTGDDESREWAERALNGKRIPS